MTDRRAVAAVLVGLVLMAGEAPPERPARAGRAGGVPRDYGPYPHPDVGYVTDLADLLAPEEEKDLEIWLYETERRSGVEIAVVTITSIRDYPGTANGSIEAFAAGLMNVYGVGNLPKNDGVLLLVAVIDRKARIELGAHYGRARDADAQRIMDRTILPRFRKGDYARGVREGVRAIMREFAGVRVGINWTLIVLLAAAAVGTVVSVDLFRHGKRGWGWVVAGIVIILLLVIVQVVTMVLRSRSRAWAGASGSVGGFGGGFGGGFSGGGGATGSW